MLKTTASTVIFWLVVVSVVVLAVAGIYINGQINNLMQVLFALGLVVILFAIGFSIYNMEQVNALRSLTSNRKKIPVFVGMKDLATSSNEAYETLDRNSPTYLELPPSYGQQGGGEYTYNFWLYIDGSKKNDFAESAAQNGKKYGYGTDGGVEDTINVNDINIEDKKLILFLRGSKQLYHYKGICYKNEDGRKYKTDIMVKSPLVKLERNLNVLTVEFNIMSNPDGVKEKSRDSCDDMSNDWEAMNAYQVSLKDVVSKYDKQWMMITIVLRDTLPSDPLAIRNKIRCTIYVNGVIELDKYIDGNLDSIERIGSTLKQNTGHLYIHPDVGIDEINANFFVRNSLSGSNPFGSVSASSVKGKYTGNPSPLGVIMADLTYLNYAPDSAEVKAMFNDGFSKKWAPSLSQQLSKNIDVTFMDQTPTMADKAVLSQLYVK